MPIYDEEPKQLRQQEENFDQETSEQDTTAARNEALSLARSGSAFATPAPNKSGVNSLPSTNSSSENNAKPETKPASEKDQSWYKPEGAKKKTKSWFNKKKTATIAGIVASTLGLTAFIAAPLTAPLEFVHAAQSLRLPHFGAQEDAGDTRLNALMRYAKSGDPGQTRLSYLESKYYNRITVDMEKAGFKADYDKGSYYKGMYVDTTSEKSPYRGLSDQEVKQNFEKKFGAGTFEKRDGRYYLNEKTSYREQHRAFKIIAKDMGYNGVTAAMRARTLEKFGVVTWHPLKKIDKKVNQSVLQLYEDWKKERDARIKSGDKTPTIDTKNAVEEDKDGNKTPLEGAGQTGEVNKSSVKTTLDSISASKGASVAGGLAAVAGFVCVVDTVNDNIGDIRYEQVAKPLMRQGMDVITAGEQVASGLDFNDTQLELYSKIYRGKDSNGKTTEWSQAESIRANNGGDGGVPLDQNVSDLLANKPVAALNWVNDPSVSGLVGGVCSGAGQVVTGVVSVALGVISGGVVSQIVGFLASAVLTGPIIDYLSSLIAGDAVDVSVVGAQFGAQADMGAKLAADFASLQSGGDILSATQTAELQSVTTENDLYAFGLLPLKDRLFDTKNRHSLVSKLVDYSPKTKDELHSSIASMFTNSFTVLASSIGSLSPTASAQTLDYDYADLPKFGYALSQLADSKYADPYENAEKAAQLLESDAGEEYISKALNCYGVTILKSAQGWAGTTTTDAYQTYYTDKREASCSDSTDENWMRIRFFIFDTATLEAYACLQGDAESCSNSGFGSGAAATAPAAGSGPISLSDLTKESVSVPCAAGTKDLGVMDGYTEGTLVKIRVCAIPGIKSVNGSIYTGDGGDVAINSRLSGAWLALAQKAKADGVTLESRSGFRTMAAQQAVYERNGRDSRAGATPGYSNHQMGLAIDFHGTRIIKTSAQSCSTRVMDLGSTTWKWLNNNTAAYGIKQYSAESWHWDPDPGGIGNRCGGDGSLRS